MLAKTDVEFLLEDSAIRMTWISFFFIIFLFI